MMEQTEMDFTARASADADGVATVTGECSGAAKATAKRPDRKHRSGGVGVRRPHHRTTTLTTTRVGFEEVCRLKDGETAVVEFPNDIVSSAKGGESVYHHSIRRISLLRRQLQGGYRSVKVRYEKGYEVNCLLVGEVEGDVDSCVGRTEVRLATKTVVV